MRWTTRSLFCFTSLIAAIPAVASESVDVKLNYKYVGEPKQPQHKQKYCLEIVPSEDLSPRSIDKFQKACALAAGLKDYHVVGKEADCHKITVDLDVEENDNDYTKTAHFSFFDGTDTRETLNVMASFHSEKGSFNSYSMIAVCRAAFNDVPAHSKTFHVEASTEPDDHGNRSGNSPSSEDEYAINGNGMYVMSELMLNGLGASVGYYFSESLTAEAGFLSLSRSLNMDAQSLDKYYVKTRLFYSRKAYIGLGVAWQTAYFDDRYELTTRDTIESLPANAGPSPREFKGSLSTMGGEASLGVLLAGASHKKGLNVGIDFVGVYKAWQVTRDNLTIATSDADLRKRIVSKVKDEDVYYVLRLLVGYTF